MKGHNPIAFDRRIPLMVPQSLDKEIRKAAEESTLSVSAFIRQAVLSHCARRLRLNSSHGRAVRHVSVAWRRCPGLNIRFRREGLNEYTKDALRSAA